MNRDDIVSVLNEKVTDFSYKKADGELRQAKGTRMLSEVPAEKLPKSEDSKENAQTVRYYDMNSDGWRSFRVENFVGFADES